jgi:hypothetical protein
MYSALPPDGIEPAIRGVFLTILIIFFVLVIASWWVASKEWQKEETTDMENSPKPDIAQDNQPE